MKPLNLSSVKNHVNEHIVDFHQRKLKSLEELKLEKLLTKNPYLFRAKNLVTPQELVDDLLTAFLSSSEEKLFGDFLFHKFKSHILFFFYLYHWLVV